MNQKFYRYISFFGLSFLREQNFQQLRMLEKDVNDMWINKSKYVNKFLKISKKYNSGSTFAKSIESIKILVNEQ